MEVVDHIPIDIVAVAGGGVVVVRPADARAAAGAAAGAHLTYRITIRQP